MQNLVMAESLFLRASVAVSPTASTLEAAGP